jgi:hypothetical protein
MTTCPTHAGKVLPISVSDQNTDRLWMARFTGLLVLIWWRSAID